MAEGQRTGLGLLLRTMICFVFFLAVRLPDARAAEVLSPQVLILNSYHKGYAWTDEQTEGITAALKQETRDPVIYTEYIDWKRQPSERNLRQQYEMLKMKYAGVPLDMVLATDDVALDFALKHRKEILNDAPIVFSGVNQVGLEQHNEYERLTGVLEDPDPDGSIKLALELNPNIRKVYLIFDNTESGLTTGKMVIDRLLNQYGPSLQLYPLNRMTREEILNKASSLQQDSILFMTTYSSDSTGRIIEVERFTRELSEISTVPVYHIYDFGLNHGALGGSLFSGREQGQAAAELAVRVLGGEAIDPMPVSSSVEPRLVLDYRQLVRFGLPIERLPADAEIVNRPFSFYETYRKLVIGTGAVFFVLLILIALLLFYLRQNRNMRRSLELANERFQLAAEGSKAVLWELDLRTKRYYFSDSWYKLLGYGRNEVKEAEEGWRELIHPEDKEQEAQRWKEHLAGQSPDYSSEFRLQSRSGAPVWVEARGRMLPGGTDGGEMRLAGSMVDVSERKEFEHRLDSSYRELASTYAELAQKQKQLQASENKYRRLAYMDSLSGLPNRLSLTEKLNRFRERNPDGTAALFFLDLDNFKNINDSMGHGYGDMLLVLAGERLRQALGGRGARFRFGGDEFVVFVRDLTGDAETEAAAEALVHAFEEPFHLQNSAVHVSVSVGVARYPQDGTGADELLQNADIAMYKAKQKGKSTYAIYGRDMREQFEERLVIERHLRNALPNGELELHYQPIMESSDNRIWGFEALLRWVSPELGRISPLSFVRIAEESQLIVPIGEWALRTACEFIKGVHRSGFADCRVSVNISVVQLMTEGFAEMVFGILEEHGLGPEALELEITESVIMHSYESIGPMLEWLKNQGIGIAVDDFGTGYSSLSYLKRLPITGVKIDKSFIDNVTDSASSAALAATIVSMGRELGLKVTAEGVETGGQLGFLKETGCDKIQGYWISRPLPADRVQDWLRSYTNPA